MVNDILNAITKQMDSTFGNSYSYYVENVEQHLQKPCFTIDMLEPRERSINYNRYRRTMPIVVHYFNDERTTNKKDSYDIAERLADCLEYLDVNGQLLRGENISWQITDGVLQLFMTYRFDTIKLVDKTNMELLEGTKVTSK